MEKKKKIKKKMINQGEINNEGRNIKAENFNLHPSLFSLTFIGRKTNESINHIMSLCAFAIRIISNFCNGQKDGSSLVRKVVIEQIYDTAIRILPVIIFVAVIIGSMIIIQFGRVSGQYNLGKITVLLIVREIGPIVTAILLILRTATAMTVEIGYMNLFNEIEAIEMAGIDPMRIICYPRMIGICCSIICLFIVFDLVAIIGGYAFVWTVTYIPLGGFLEQIGKSIIGSDIAVGIVKAICFGIVITTTSLYFGFVGKKDITGIPKRTSRAALACFFYCLVINVIISALFYL